MVTNIPPQVCLCFSFESPNLAASRYHHDEPQRAFERSIMASCKADTEAYRKCLKDSRNSGGAQKCTHLAKILEACREKWRRENDVQLQFDGTRVLPNSKCLPLNHKVQHCLKWKQGDESQCQPEIQGLKGCISSEQGHVAAPTAGDKLWSDYKGPK